MSQTISRRSMLSTTGRAAVATLSLGIAATSAPAAFAASGADPIYAAMQAHWACFEAFEAACRRESRSVTAAEKAASDAEQEATDDAEFEAARAILNVEPTTVAGALAFLDYVTEFSANGYRGWPDREPEEGERVALGDYGHVTFEDDAMRLVSRSLKRLLAGGGDV